MKLALQTTSKIVPKAITAQSVQPHQYHALQELISQIRIRMQLLTVKMCPWEDTAQTLRGLPLLALPIVNLDLRVRPALPTAELPFVLSGTSVRRVHLSKYSALSRNIRTRSARQLAKPVPPVSNAQYQPLHDVNQIYPLKA